MPTTEDRVPAGCSTLSNSVLAKASTRSQEAHGVKCLREIAKKMKDPSYPLDVPAELIDKVHQALIKILKPKET